MAVRENNSTPTRAADNGERRKTERELRKERDFISAVLSVAGALVCVIDREGRLVRFNKACEEASGYTSEEIVGQFFWRNLLLPEEAEEVRAVFADLRSGSFPNEHENHWVRKDGGRRLIRWSNTVILDDAGDVDYIIGTGIDVTEQRAAERTAREVEKKYRLVVENLHEGLCLADADTRPIFVNDRLTAMLGYTREEMLGQPIFRYLDDDGIEIAKRQLELRRQGIRAEYELEMIRKDGTRFQALMLASPIQDDSGRFAGILAGILDITERKIAHESLRNAHAELERRVRERTQDLQQALGQVAQLKDRLEADNLRLREEAQSSQGYKEIIGESAALQDVLRRVDMVAATEAAVLILGETGTGKELIAHAIHNLSVRRNKPLIKVNCAALPSTLIENELFGHERGAFTGALSVKAGRFELADGGTIFLDEIGDLSPDIQVKLLRVLQEGEFQRLGSTRTQKVSVRVIAATSRDIEDAMIRGRFRSDLYYRLGVFPITIPPLRERKEDIPLLVWSFLGKRQAAFGKTIRQVPNEVMDALMRYEWPGNVRELQNVIERALIFSMGPTLVLDESFGHTRIRRREEPVAASLGAVERAHILRVVKECGWKIKGAGNAAYRLGLNPSTLRDRMRKLGIERPKGPSPD